MEFFNPNVAGEMAQLLINNQKNYVPCYGEGETKKASCSRNVIGTFQDGDNEFDRLEGLHPEFADWQLV